MSRTRRNFASMVFSQLATQLVTLLILAVLPRSVGITTYGELVFAGTFVGFFSLVSLLGTRSFLVKEVARHPDQLGSYVVNALVMKLVLGSVLAVGAATLARVLGYPERTVLLVETGCVGMVLGALSDVLQGGLQATGRMGQIALWGAVQQYVVGGVAIAVLLSHFGVVWFALVLALGQAIPLVIYGYKLWPEVRGHLAVDLKVWGTVAAGGIPFALWGAILLVYGSIDIIMLQAITGSTTVAWYNLAYTWVGVPIFLPTILTTVILPTLSTSALNDSPDFSRTVNRAICVTVLAGAPMAVGVALVAGNIIALLHYPAGYHHAISLIQILAMHIPIVGMDMVLATALIAKDRQKAWLVVGIIASVFNPAVNLAAIPWAVHRYGNGAVGASVVTVLTELLMMVGAIILRPAGVLDRGTVSFALRSVVASVAMIPAVLAVAGAPLPAKIALGMSVFAAAAFTLRLVSVQKLRGAVSETLDVLRQRGLAPVPTTVE